MPIGYTYSRNALNIFVDGRPLIVGKDHANFKVLFDGLRSGSLNEKEVVRLVDQRHSVRDVVERFPELGFALAPEGVTCHGGLMEAELLNIFLEKASSLGASKIDPTFWFTFVSRTLKNPSPTARASLLARVLAEGAPITPDGTFIAYKKVNDAKLPAASEHQVAHEVGSVIDAGQSAKVLNFSSWVKLPNFPQTEGSVLVCEIAPEDVISVYDTLGVTSKLTVLDEVSPHLTGFAYQSSTIPA